MELKKTVKAANGAPWIHHIPLNEGVSSDNMSCVRYLVDEIKVETMNKKFNSYTALQCSIIWGKLDIMVYLLSRGGDPMLAGGTSIVDMGRLRQQRLQSALDEAHDGAEFEGVTITKSQIRPLFQKGVEMLEVLEGVEKYGSFPAWAQSNGSHPLVKRFSSGLGFAECRYELAFLRALVLAERASLHKESVRAKIAAEHAAELAAKAKEEQPLMDALVEAGYSKKQAKDIRDTFSQPTVKALKAAQLSAEYMEKQLDVYVRQGHMSEGERRRFIRLARESEEPAPAASKAAAKSTAKAKAKPPAAMAALKAAGAKAAAKGNAAAKAGSGATAKAQKGGPIDSIAMLFSADLPDSVFMHTTRFLFCR